MRASYSTRSISGFSLVELSIVLVILGLLTGGILAGRSLIRASELRAVTTEHSRYLTATQAFRGKYFGLPGDITNATLIWGKSAIYCNSHSGTAATPGTCNGNGDGQINRGGAPNSSSEMFQYWTQLALGGLIEGTYTGASSSGGSIHTVIGTNVPPSKLAGGGWGSIYRDGVATAVSVMWDDALVEYGNTLMLGADRINGSNYDPVLRPEEAWNIDTKLDDGKPGLGKMIIFGWNSCSDANDFSDLDSDYDLTNSAVACTLVFVRQF